MLVSWILDINLIRASSSSLFEFVSYEMFKIDTYSLGWAVFINVEFENFRSENGIGGKDKRWKHPCFIVFFISSRDPKFFQDTKSLENLQFWFEDAVGKKKQILYQVRTPIFYFSAWALSFYPKILGVQFWNLSEL